MLDLVIGPARDIGCGRGRHPRALAARGVAATGLELTPAVAGLARAGGATVIDGSVFGPVPGTGTWASALLLDGNIGMGGNPLAVLVRVSALLAPRGRILVEAAAPGTGRRRQRARLEHPGGYGPWSTGRPWAPTPSPPLPLPPGCARTGGGRPAGGGLPDSTSKPLGGSARMPRPKSCRPVTARNPLPAATAAVIRGVLAAAYRRQGGLVFGVARRVTGFASGAEEVTQTVFIELWRRSASTPLGAACEPASPQRPAAWAWTGCAPRLPATGASAVPPGPKWLTYPP